MKALTKTAMVLIVVLVASTTTEARYGNEYRARLRQRFSYGNGYGYGGGYGSYGGYGKDRSLSDALFGWTDDRELKMLEKDQDFRHQQEQETDIYPKREQVFENASLRGKIQHLEDENQRLREENAKLRKQLSDMQKQLDKLIELVTTQQNKQPSNSTQ